MHIHRKLMSFAQAVRLSSKVHWLQEFSNKCARVFVFQFTANAIFLSHFDFLKICDGHLISIFCGYCVTNTYSQLQFYTIEMVCDGAAAAAASANKINCHTVFALTNRGPFHSHRLGYCVVAADASHVRYHLHCVPNESAHTQTLNQFNLLWAFCRHCC